MKFGEALEELENGEKVTRDCAAWRGFWLFIDDDGDLIYTDGTNIFALAELGSEDILADNWRVI